MARRRLEGRGGLLADIQTAVLTEPLDSLFHITGELGRGKFAVVKKCVEKATGKEFAAKFVRKRRRGRDCRADVIHEMAVLETARCNPRIINLHAAYENEHDVILLLEYAAGGEIFDHCVSDELLSEGQIVRLIRQILEGVNLLHQSNIVHLDLKPQNILLTGVSPLGDIKIVDFGLAAARLHWRAARDRGTPEYVAPEILNYEPITTATDLWSVGVITYMLVTGESPFAGEDKQQTFLNVSQVNVDYSKEAFSHVSELAVHFIRKLLVKAPEDRPKRCGLSESPVAVAAVPGTRILFSSSNPTRPRERSGGAKWASAPEDLEDKENILDSPQSKRCRFEDDAQARESGI